MKIMTKNIVFLSLCTFLVSNSFAKESTERSKKAYNHELSFLLGDSENGFDQGLDRSLAYQLQYMYKGFDFPIKPEVAFIYSNNIPTYYSREKESYSSLLVNGVYEIEYIDLLTPYVKAGLGYRHSSDTDKHSQNDILFNAGAGLKMNFNPQWALKAEVQANFSNERDNLLAMIGVSYSFGERPQKQVEVAPIVEQEAAPEIAPEPVKPVVVEKASKAVVIAPIPIVIAKEPVQDLHIRFKFNSAELTPSSKESLKQYAESIETDDKSSINIVGNTDSIGKESYNLKLSVERANAVKFELVKNSVPAGLITIEGDGESNPVADNTTAEGREKNRRASIFFSEGE